jgi:ABC-type multidrug transport system ATPase subunit
MSHAAQVESPEIVRLQDAGGAILSASGVTKRWARGQAPILDGVDFELQRGALIGLQGANGAGKTTFLRILAGLFLPESGSVSLDGLDPVRHRRAYQRRLGFVPAGQGALYARMSVKGHLEYWARLALLPPADRGMAVEVALGRFDLLPLAGNRVDRLSMGQRQRVRLAMGFLHGPDVVLLDEPSNSLDEAGLDRLHTVIDDFRGSGKTVLWCGPTVRGVGLEFDVLHELVNGKLVRL